MKKFIFTIAALIFGLSQMTAQNMIFPDEVIEVPQGGSAPLTIKYETGGKVITTYMFNFVLPDGLSLTQGKTGMDWQMDEANDVFQTMPDGTTGMACLSTDPSKYFLAGTSGTLGSVGIEAAATLPISDDILEIKATSLAFSEYVGGNYETINFDDVVIKVKIVENRITLDENAEKAPAAAENVNVKVLRTINANSWSTICLPFDMDATQVKSAFGDDVELAEFAGWAYEEDDNGDCRAITVDFTSCSTITSNTPLIIKTSTNISDFKIDNVTINPDDAEITLKESTDNKKKGSMVGTYKPIVLDEDWLFLNSNKFYYSSGKTKMKAFRAYFDLFYTIEGDYKVTSAKINFSVDGEATTIDGIGYQRVVEGVYDLSGRKIKLEDGDLTKLQKGVYIINGKKVTIK